MSEKKEMTIDPENEPVLDLGFGNVYLPVSKYSLSYESRDFGNGQTVFVPNEHREHSWINTSEITLRLIQDRDFALEYFFRMIKDSSITAAVKLLLRLIKESLITTDSVVFEELWRMIKDSSITDRIVVLMDRMIKDSSITAPLRRILETMCGTDRADVMANINTILTDARTPEFDRVVKTLSDLIEFATKVPEEA